MRRFSSWNGVAQLGSTRNVLLYISNNSKRFKQFVLLSYNRIIWRTQNAFFAKKFSVRKKHSEFVKPLSLLIACWARNFCNDTYMHIIQINENHRRTYWNAVRGQGPPDIRKNPLIRNICFAYRLSILNFRYIRIYCIILMYKVSCIHCPLGSSNL